LFKNEALLEDKQNKAHELGIQSKEKQEHLVRAHQLYLKQTHHDTHGHLLGQFHRPKVKLKRRVVGDCIEANDI
jgi:hypothetical protein